MKTTTVLFDFDGVVTNTEPQYNAFFEKISEKYNLGIDNFGEKIKGVKIDEGLDLFPQITDDLKKTILKESENFEAEMDFPLIAGVENFIAYLKINNFKIGLVTSSPLKKMKIALRKLNMENTFTTLVTAERVSRGKPDPMCYLTAAKDLNSSPQECIVFEDSLAGIEAGLKANMKVVAVTSTLTKEILLQKTKNVIKDFTSQNEIHTFIAES